MFGLNKLPLTLSVISLVISGCSGATKSRGLGFPSRGKPIPTLRLVPIPPPEGQTPYPRGTRIDQQNSVIYFPPGGGPTPIWLGVIISGWGERGLVGYDFHVLRGPICPSPPCDCEPEPWVVPCQSNDDCFEGSDCVGGECNEAYIETERRKYVFEDLAHMHSAEETPTSYRFHARLDQGIRPVRDRGKSAYAGTLVYFTGDLCPMLEQWDIRVDPSAQNRIKLGDGSEMKPLLGNVTVVQQKTP